MNSFPRPRLLPWFGLLVIFASVLTAAPPSAEQTRKIKSEIDAMMADFERGDVKRLMDQTHPAVFELAGGRDQLEGITQSAVNQLIDAGVKFEESALGEPSDLYPAGEYELCFVPRTSVIAAMGRRVKSVGFMVAILQPDGVTWRYIDGSGIGRSPELLFRMFPGLSREADIPEQHSEVL